MFQAFFLCILLLSSLIDARKVKIGSPPRGVSAARAGSAAQPHGNVPQGGFAPHQQPGGFQGPYQQGGFRPAQPGGYHPNQPGGFHPNQPGGFHPNQPGGFHPNQGFGHAGFNTGTGPGSISRGSQFKTALAAGALGAVGGIATYELGKAIIRSASEPFHVNNRPYYFDDHNYQQKNGYSMCSMPLEELLKQTQASTTTNSPVSSGTSDNESVSATTPSPDQLLANIQFKDGSKPKTIVWGCKTGSEVCCGTECCPAPSQPTSVANDSSRGSSFAGIAFGVLVAILILMCCCCCLVYKFFRSAFDICLPTSARANDPNVTYTSDKYIVNPPNYDSYPQQQQQQGYPLQQPYPNPQQGMGYPPSQGYSYPSQPPAFQQYPANPMHNY